MARDAVYQLGNRLHVRCGSPAFLNQSEFVSLEDGLEFLERIVVSVVDGKEKPRFQQQPLGEDHFESGETRLPFGGRATFGSKFSKPQYCTSENVSPNIGSTVSTVCTSLLAHSRSHLSLPQSALRKSSSHADFVNL